MTRAKDISKIVSDANFGGTLDVGGAFTSLGIDDNANATAITIDSSENVLVGKTNQTANVAGTEIEGSGTIVSTRASNTNLFLNRTGNDGDLINFRKDNTILGSIQSRAGSMLSIALNPSGSDGAGFTGGSNAVLPVNATALSDNAIDLGVGSYRYKDLYLSGGAFIGGTGAANKLDDYEEGTFTAQISTDTTYVGDSAQLGVYTKIGDICFFQIRFQRTGTLNSGSNARFGLPFTSANNGVQASGFRGSVENIDTSMVGIGGVIAANNTILYLNEMTAAVTGSNVNGNDLGANFQVQIQGFYKTA